MATKSYNTIFKGYYLESGISSVSQKSGIYIVYSCAFDATTNTVSLNNIIYIGQATNLQERLKNHERKDDFEKEAKNNGSNYIVCYSVAEVPVDDLDIVENALIFVQKPILNCDLKDNYLHDEASFKFEGECELLSKRSFKIIKNNQ